MGRRCEGQGNKRTGKEWIFFFKTWEDTGGVVGQRIKPVSGMYTPLPSFDSNLTLDSVLSTTSRTKLHPSVGQPGSPPTEMAAAGHRRFARLCAVFPVHYLSTQLLTTSIVPFPDSHCLTPRETMIAFQFRP